MRTRAKAADPSGLDLPYLATSYGIPEHDLHQLLDTPTHDGIQQLFETLNTKGRDFDDLQAVRLKLEVELENTVRTSESKAKAQKAAVAKNINDVEELRTKLSEAEGAREALALELDRLKSSTSGSTNETQVLRRRIETLEASNRDALALVESKSTEKDRVTTELSEQHGKLLTLRCEINRLEERNEALANAASAQKFKEQSWQQEIDLLKRNNEWHSNELQTRNQEHAKFRKERNARIATLQRELEDATASVDNLKRTETGLRQRWDDLQIKAEEAFGRIASLEEDTARREQDSRTELDSTRRLAGLQAQNAATHKARLQEVQSQVEQIQEDAAEEIGKMQAEVETERSDKEQAERRVAELEMSIERLEHQPRTSRPGTPMRNGHGGTAANSPSAMPGSARKIVGGLSFTQLYSNYTELQQDLEGERRRTTKLSTAMDELITEMESRGPEIVELKSEQERLEGEVLDFSRLLDASIETRDNAVKETQRWQGQASAAAREGEVLRQQLRDLSTQVKILLVELQSRDQGLDDLSAQERFDLERAARGELEEGAVEEMTETGRLISERLVIFRNVDQLQEKNMELLRVTRQLGEQMEGEEAREKARQSLADAQEVDELKHKLVRYEDELEATTTQISSYVKERDMFRRMLQHRGQIAPDTDLHSMFGQSMGPPSTPHRNGTSGEPQTPRSKDVEDLNRLVREQQSFFDQYRDETSSDRKILKEQVDTLTKEKGISHADLARAQSQLTLASERYEMLRTNFTALRNENSELQKRSHQLSENAAKQDLRTQQVVEELVEARSMSDGLRNESANIKAEKELSKRIEARVSEENKNLVDERSRLQKQFTNLQILQNERELTDSENRRRLQSRIEVLESELTEARKKLDSESEDNRKTILRREYEEGQSRTRIDDLVRSLSTTREELVAAKTTRDQLQARVDEMKIDLRAAEDKAMALQPRPSPRHDRLISSQHAEGDGDELPLEQRSALEASEYRRDLQLAHNELDGLRREVEQYKGIAQATEEELASFNDTSEQYKQETDVLLAAKEAHIKELEERIEHLSAELTTSNEELSDLRSKADDNTHALAEQKTAFEAELISMRDDAERYAVEKNLYQQDLKAQAEIAQQAQQSYEDELLKHAEAARSLQSVRKEYHELRTQVAGIRAEAEANKASLERGEESWAEQRERFERELEEVKRRREDVDQQNRILHQQMERFSSELAALRTGRSTLPLEEEEGVLNAAPANGNSLQDVIKYLRREKEIVDVQYELSIQEAKRLQQQLEHANHQLEDARQSLADERSAGNDSSGTSTDKLMQTINELNLFRESSTTLRNEARQAREKLEEKAKEVERLAIEIDPLKSRVGELEGDLESKEGELKLIHSDRDHWRERTQNIISKYDRVDPAELEEIKKKLENVKTEKERLEAEQAPLRAQIASHTADMEAQLTEKSAALSATLARFKDQAKEQNRKQNERIRELSGELASLRTELEAARTDVEKSKTALDGARASAILAKQDISELETVKAELQLTKTALTEAEARIPANNDDEEGQVHEDGAQTEDHVGTVIRLAEAETTAREHAARAAALNTELETRQTRVSQLESQVSDLQQQLENAHTAAKLTHASVEEGQSVAQVSTVDPQQAENSKSVADQVAEEIVRLRADMAEQHELAKKQVEEERDRKIENSKSNLRRQLKDEREKMRDEVRKELVEEHEQALQKLRDEHDATIKQLQEEHQIEMARLTQDGSAAVTKATNKDIVVNSKTSDLGALDLSDEQVVHLMQTNERVKRIISVNIGKRSAAEIEKFTKIIEEKDAEITVLKATQGSTVASGTDDQMARHIQELTQQLEAAKSSRDAAVKNAQDMAEMKAKLQVSQLAQSNAKLAVVRKAAADTPEKPVSEVWEIANKAKPVAKPPVPAPILAANPIAVTSSVAAPVALGTMVSPVPPPGSPATQNTQQMEQEKLRNRQARFGNIPPPTPVVPSTFGQPSGLTGVARSSTPTSGSNPQAHPFIPQTTSSTVAASRGGAGGIPRGRGGSAQPARGGGAPTTNIQGAATSSLSTTRGNLQSGIARPGSQIGRGGRAGRGGSIANAGQKRAHDGSDVDGNEAKRTRGGGGGTGAGPAS